MTNSIEISGLSNKGRKEINQDSFGSYGPGVNGTMLVVADGVGSVVESEIISKELVDFFIRAFESDHIYNHRKWYDGVFHNALRFLRKKYGKRELASTLTVCIFKNNKCYVLNCGDSRLYLVDDKEAKCVTVDHNYLNYLKSKKKDFEEIMKKKDQWGHLIYCFDLLSDKSCKYDYDEIDASDFHSIFLATDGVYEYIDEDHWSILTNNNASASDTCHNLIANSLQNHSPDDMTCVVLRKR